MGDVLEGHPALDELVRVPRRWWKSPREVWKMRRRLRAMKFDIAIDLQCLSKSAITAWLSGARRRIGKSGEHGRELSRVFNNELVEAGGTHVIEHYLSMLRPLGIESPAVRFDMPERAADAQMADKFLRDSGLVGQRFAILNPGAGWPSKMWPAERYGELARHLHRNARHAERGGVGPGRGIAAGGNDRRRERRARRVGAADVDAGTRCTVPPGGAVCRLRYGADAPGGGRRHAHDQHARAEPGRLVRRVRSAQRSDADSLRRRFVARAAPGRRLGDAGDHRRNGGTRLRSTAGPAGGAEMRVNRQIAHARSESLNAEGTKSTKEKLAE